jgi:hypothetical protein
MENDLRVKYDSICYKTFLNVRYLTEGADCIVLKNFDYNDNEHQFVLAVVVACSSILGNRDLAIDINLFQRKLIAKKYPAIGKIKKVTGKENKVVDVPDLLDFMRPSATELCGEYFTFEDIYNEYYAERK